MELLPMDIGPLNPPVPELVAGAVLFALCYLAMIRLLRRINRVLEAREEATEGVGRRAEDLRAEAEATREEVRALLADARHDAARIRQRAQEEGAALITAARADGVRERDGLLADAAARIEAERTAAEAALRVHAAGLATELASRVLGEPVAPAPTADTR